MEITQEQWNRYHEDLAAHEQMCKYFKLAFERVDWLVKDRVDKGTASWIHTAMENELSRITHMDAPNKPGYYRANND